MHFAVNIVSAVDDLKKLRRRLVDSRRKAAAEGARPASDEVQASRSVQTIQDRIEAIDRAIADEQALATGPSPSIIAPHSPGGEGRVAEFAAADRIAAGR